MEFNTGTIGKREQKVFLWNNKKRHRSKDYELAMQWLIDCGLVHKVNRCSKPSIPLIAYEDFGAFKLFLVDIGLLAAMSDLDVKTLLEGNNIFREFKGSLTEQYIHQQLLSQKEMSIYYWSTEKSTSEIDFLVQIHGRVIPIEVKATENLQAKSLKIFCQKYQQSLAVRTSMSDFRKDDWLTNLPLYAISELTNL